jgi:hypothetical protein
MPRLGLRKLKALGVAHTREVKPATDKRKTRYRCAGCGVRVAPPSFSLARQAWVAVPHKRPDASGYCLAAHVEVAS